MATARPLGEQALRLARQLDSGPLLIDVLAVLSTIYSFAGEPERGLPLGREAVERARTLGDDVLLGRAMSGYLQCSEVIDPARIVTLYAEAIAATRRSGDQFFAGILHNNASVAALGSVTSCRPGPSGTGGPGGAGDRATRRYPPDQPGLGAASGR